MARMPVHRTLAPPRSGHHRARAPVRVAVVVAATALSAGCTKANPDFIGQSTTAATAATTATGSGPTTGAADTTVGQGSSGMTESGGLACAPMLDSIRLTIFATQCTSDGCHSGDPPAAGLDLTTVDLFQDLLDIPSATCAQWSRVVAESPTQSILFAKVAGIATCDVDEPTPHQEITEAEQACLSGWIENIAACERCGGTECIDTANDAQNCGACGNVCPAGVSCVGGMCDCPGTGIACRGACIDPEIDPLHCGGCGNDCAGSACAGGTCQCIGGLTNCGACVDTDTDAMHCGGCDMPCGPGQECAGAMCVCSTTPVSFANDVQPLLTANCIGNGCHSGANPKKDLDLSVGTAFADLVGVPSVECMDGRLRVAAGSPPTSYLMDKLLGVNMCSGVQMPRTGGPGEPLNDAQLGTVWAWICQGALNN